jgi:general secretion pathway protein E
MMDEVKTENQIAHKKTADKTLGSMLVESNLINPQDLEIALGLQKTRKQRLGAILVDQGFVTIEDIVETLSKQLNLPLVNLKDHKIHSDALSLIPEDMARRYMFIPLELVDDSLVIVMAYPDDIRAIRDIGTHCGMRIVVAIGIPSEIERAINIHYRSSDEIEKQISELDIPDKQDIDITSESIANTPVAQSLNLIINQAVRDRASDIHFEPQEKRLRVRYRIDGILHDMFSLPISVHAPMLSRIKILADMNIAEHRRPQDGQIKFSVGNREVDIRAASMGTVHGETATLRILDKSISLLNLRELGFIPEILKQFEAMLKSAFGMILVGGPTGSGKTTSLYAAINHLDRDEGNILTVEDPVEYNFNDITQTQVNAKAGVTFVSGLRAILRHDPDIILIGEVRDRDTASIAVQSALTGHLVLASIHANDSVSMFFRLMDLGIEPHLISTTLIGLLSQRILRRVCQNCRHPYEPSIEEKMAYKQELKEDLGTAYRGRGCNLCANTGYMGRTVLLELLSINDAIRGMLLKNSSAEAIRTQAIKDGMISMRTDGMLKAKEGITTISEVLRCMPYVG